MPSAFVVGSTGYVGSRLLAALTRSGFEVTASARDVTSLDKLDPPNTVSRVELDADSADSCQRALAQAAPLDVAYYLIHSIGGGGEYAKRDLSAARRFIAAAQQTGVSRVVYLGGFVPEGEQLSAHLDSRADVGAELSRTPVDLVWLRAAVILGAGSASYELVRYLADRLPVIPMPSWMQQPVAPIAVDDVLRYLVLCADPAVVPPGSYDISNGQNLTYADLIQHYSRSRGYRRSWLKLRGISPALAAPIIRRLTPLPGELVAELVESLANSMDSADTRIRQLTGVPAAGLTTLDDAISRAAITDDFAARSVFHTLDPLKLCDSDPGWAGGRQYHRRKASNKDQRPRC